MQWVILYLALNPDKQEKLWLEVMNVVGPTAVPSFEDRSDMPYTKSVMLEIFRIASTSPFANFHHTTAAVEFKGYHIPKDTVIVGNLFGLHHDENLWSEPEKFQPERFVIDKKENSLPPMIPFSVGLRTCLGQQYFKSTFFVMLTSIIQQFRLDWDVSVPRPTEDELIRSSRVSIFRFCPKYKIIVKNRNEV